MDVGDKASALTWLQAAERVLLEEGPEMHIKDLTSRIMELGIVKSSCTTSLETLLYRHTSKGYSKFVRVPGKMGCFALNEHVIREHSNMQPLEDNLMPSSVPSPWERPSPSGYDRSVQSHESSRSIEALLDL